MAGKRKKNHDVYDYNVGMAFLFSLLKHGMASTYFN